MTEVSERICNRCKRMLALENFSRQKGGKYGRLSVCKECKRTEGREAARTGRWPSFTPEGQRSFSLRKKYGISSEQYDVMLSAQDGKCALCLGTENNGTAKALNMPVDHDHNSKHVRGILCSTCNMWLGNFEEFISRLPNGVASIRGYLTPKSTWLAPEYPEPKDKTTKQCTKCTLTKPASEFTVSHGHYLNAECKPCAAERVRNTYATNAKYREATRARAGRWKKTVVT